MKENNVIVSVFMITYQHEAYIAQAIESVISQKTNFRFELVIGEDSGKDNTRKICEQYKEKYPDIINLLPSDRNYGMMENASRIFMACTGKYIAMCEGDDYWNTPDKLQKQVDFLESNPDFALCFSAVEIKDELNWNWPYEKYYPILKKDVFTIDDFILSELNIIPTPTLVFRNVLPHPLPEFFRKALFGDIGIQLFAADKGKGKYFPEKLAVYRNHAGGITKSEEHIKKMTGALMKYLKEVNEFLGFRYNAIFKKRFLEMTKVELIYGAGNKKGMERIKHYFSKMPEYIKYSDSINLKELVYYHMVLFFPSLLKSIKKKN